MRWPKLHLPLHPFWLFFCHVHIVRIVPFLASGVYEIQESKWRQQKGEWQRNTV